MIKLILADMDGTLLPFGSRVVSERTHSAILSALDAGIAFGPASGRDYADLADAFDGDARCFSTGIMANGKKVFQRRTRVQKDARRRPSSSSIALYAPTRGRHSG